MAEFPAPAWMPAVVPTLEWTVAHLRLYLSGKRFTVFEHGTCVVWPDTEALDDDQCKERLLSVVSHHPDFKVRRHSDGDFLVTFRAGVGGLMSGEILKRNLPVLRADAYQLGKIPSEVLKEVGGDEEDDLDLIAGLYARARLYRDAQSPKIVYKAASRSLSGS